MSDTDSEAYPITEGYSGRRPDKRESVLSALLETENIAAAARVAGVSRYIITSWLRDPAFVHALFEARQRRLQTEGANLGYRVMVELAKNTETPAGVRYQAAKTLLNLGGHIEATAVAALSGAQAATLQDLSEDQLRQHIAQAEAVLAKARRPVIDGTAEAVTPDETPDSADPAALL